MTEKDLQRIEALLDEDHIWNADDEADDRKLEAWEQATRALIAFARKHPALREAIEVVLRRADFSDEGPPDEGWASPELEKARKVLEQFLTSAGDERISKGTTPPPRQ